MRVTNWRERKFDFQRQLAEAPTLMSRLAGTPARLEDVTVGIDEQVMRRRTPDTAGKLKWSVFDHAGHLWETDKIYSQQVRDFMAGAETLSGADPDNRATEEAHYNRGKLKPILTGFRIERSTMVNFLHTLEPEDFARTSKNAQTGKPLRLIDCIENISEHDDHHLAFIRELIWNPRREEQTPDRTTGLNV